MRTASTTVSGQGPLLPVGDILETLPRHALRPLLCDRDEGDLDASMLAAAERRPDLLGELVDALSDPSRAIRSAAAALLEVVARGRHRTLEPLAGRIRGAFMTNDDPAVQASLAGVVTHRRWSDAEIPAIAERLMALRASRRPGTRNAALEALSRLARRSGPAALAYAGEWEKAARGTAEERALAETLARAAALPFVGRRAGDHVPQIAARGQSAGQADITTNA